MSKQPHTPNYSRGDQEGARRALQTSAGSATQSRSRRTRQPSSARRRRAAPRRASWTSGQERRAEGPRGRGREEARAWLDRQRLARWQSSHSSISGGRPGARPPVLGRAARPTADRTRGRRGAGSPDTQQRSRRRHPRARPGPGRPRLAAVLHGCRRRRGGRPRPRARRRGHPSGRAVGDLPRLRGQPVRARAAG